MRLRWTQTRFKNQKTSPPHLNYQKVDFVHELPHILCRLRIKNSGNDQGDPHQQSGEEIEADSGA